MTPKGKYVWDPEKGAWVRSADVPEHKKEPVAPEHVKKEVTRKEKEVVESVIEVEEVQAIEEGQLEQSELDEEPRYKGAVIRAVGLVIDIVILQIITWIIEKAWKPIDWDISTLINAAAKASGDFLPVWVLPIIGFIYLVGFWTWRGQTPGKMVIRAKIVTIEGQPVGFVRSIVRWSFYVIPFFTLTLFFSYLNATITFILLLIMYFWVPFNKRKRGIHDFIAGTCVVGSSKRVVVK